MYLSYYHLNAKPFQISADPKFLWLGEKHKEALATLRYGILDNRGFVLLTGDVGTGKTTLINALINSLGDQIIVAKVPDPALEQLEFFNFVSNAFGMKQTFNNKGSFLVSFRNFLHESYAKNQKVLLIVDEAQRLNPNLLEEIRLLSNIEKEGQKLLNIFFVGQNEFNDILLGPENRALRQRITLNSNIDQLTEAETFEYIKHRLKIAGSSKKLFTSDAVHEIYRFSKGYPRLINIICDHALLTGYVEEIDRIKSKTIRECAKDFNISAHSRVSAEISRKELDRIERIGQGQPSRKKSGKLIAFAFTFLLMLITAIYLAASNGLSPYITNTIQFFRGPTTVIDKPQTEIQPQTESLALLEPGGKEPESDRQKPAVEKPGSEDTIPAPKMEDRVLDDSSPIKEIHSAAKGQDIPPLLIPGELPAKKIHSSTEGQDIPLPLIPDELPVKTIMPTQVQRESISEIKPEPILAKAEKWKKTEPRLITDRKLIIYYKYNSNELSAEAVELLDRLAMTMIHDPAIKIDAKGYTDDPGWIVYNKKLSEFRANAVKNYLVGKGVNPLNIETAGLGTDNPIAEEAPRKSREYTRRVEIELHY